MGVGVGSMGVGVGVTTGVTSGVASGVGTTPQPAKIIMQSKDITVTLKSLFFIIASFICSKCFRFMSL
ncbi:MAG: hypothetical protein E7315_00080 [Clostridiales bacterium]|nr:hypothetical protein [Clostridiales bacterium]